ncbi:unnamed protein product [Bursaphelenchus okinawaensis]|uniref:Fatty-acid and retinol-binding protein 1 n=1 Tax=Bursaphelenchus okinawaensis TaxID=465554 RepID=A0A811K2C5_9BILA|nr:unnamed protein product [Bursaphelenchus okinawaensis]CAG9090138.1 unnamed protein product [Bursaphelenchus okinawaensis]
MKWVVLCLLVAVVHADDDKDVRDVVYKLLADININVSYAKVHEDFLGFEKKAVDLVAGDEALYNKIAPVLANIKQGYISLKGEHNQYGEKLHRVQQRLQGLRDILATKVKDANQLSLFDESVEMIRGMLLIPSSEDVVNKLLQIIKDARIDYEPLPPTEVEVRHALVLIAFEAFQRSKQNPVELFRKINDADYPAIDIEHSLSTPLRHLIEDYEAVYAQYKEQKKDDILAALIINLKHQKQRQPIHLLDGLPDTPAKEIYESIVDDLMDLKPLLKK